MAQSPEVAYLGIPHPEGERNVNLEGGTSWKLGRTGENNIVIPSEWVSRQHALVQRTENGEYYLFDLGSRNGTYLNGARVTVPVTLNNGDRISFGDFHISFHCPPKEKPQAAVPGPEGMATMTYFAQKKTSVLVVDVRGFTKIAQVVDPSLLSQVIGSLFRRGGEIMQKQGSWGQKYIGDALMSVWVHERNTNFERQIPPIFRALKELVDITNTLQGQFNLPFPIGVGAGINTGAAAIGNAGSDQTSDYTALGDTVNAAFRFESATREIGLDLVIGQETMGCLKKAGAPTDRFFVEKTVKLKGYERPTNVWAATFADLRNFVAEIPEVEPAASHT